MSDVFAPEEVAEATGKPLPSKCCARCKHWFRLNEDDPTAPEGHCELLKNPGHWPTGYWPHTLQRDSSPGFEARS